jgi:hypothetical protein
VKKERRTEITLQTERSISIKSSRALTALCDRCGRDVQMFTPGQAAPVSGLSSREYMPRRGRSGSLRDNRGAASGLPDYFSDTNPRKSSW